jgi:hypothetical protein
LGLEVETVIEAVGGGPLVSPWQAAKLQRIATAEFSAQLGCRWRSRTSAWPSRRPAATAWPRSHA